MTTYTNVGRSSNTALNLKNRVENGSVSLVVPILNALPSVQIAATILKMKSTIESPLFTPLFGAPPFEISPPSTALTFIFVFQLRFFSFLVGDAFFYYTSIRNSTHLYTWRKHKCTTWNTDFTLKISKR